MVKFVNFWRWLENKKFLEFKLKKKNQEKIWKSVKINYKIKKKKKNKEKNWKIARKFEGKIISRKLTK